MVFYFYPRGYVVGKDDWLIYMGKDKYENEDLIRYGLPVDIWFHVDDMSSAHVYLRLPEGKTIDDVPQETLIDCAQLVKQNSIQGCKQNNVTIIYTMWANLRKSAAMDVGQVSFHSPKEVRKVLVERKDNDIINRLEKTRQEKYPDLKAEKETYDSLARAAQHAEIKAAKAAEKTAKDEKRRQDDVKQYKGVMKEEYMVSNSELREKYKTAEDYEDDFM